MANLIIEGGGIEVPTNSGLSVADAPKITFVKRSTGEIKSSIRCDNNGQLRIETIPDNVKTDVAFTGTTNILFNCSRGIAGLDDANIRQTIAYNSSNGYLYVGSDTETGIGTVLRGTSVKLNTNGGALITSDRNIKEDINEIENKYEEFYKRLKPITYAYSNTKSKRKHIGFIAQDVEQALSDSDITNMEFAGLCINTPKYCAEENDNAVDNFLIKKGIHDKIYSLRYEEFIALNTHMIQKQGKIIDELVETVKLLQEEINELKK